MHHGRNPRMFGTCVQDLNRDKPEYGLVHSHGLPSDPDGVP